MKKRVVFAVVVAVLIFYFAYLHLHPETLRYEIEKEVGGREVHAIFYNSKGERVASASLISRGYNGHFAFFRFVLWHKEGSNVKSLKIEILPVAENRYIGEVYLKTPEGYPWNPIKFEMSKNEPGAVVLEVPNMWFQGEGTITLDFAVVTYEKTDILNITTKTEFELLEGFKRYTGEGVSTLSMPLFRG